MNPNAAGVDCGSEAHYVAVPADRDAAPVRSFKTFTTELHRLADWLTACGVTTVAMESTGVYWIPLYEILEARGVDVVLVNARHVKNVPGRKTDVVDCQWIQELDSVGLLRGSFRPTAAIAALRAYLRHRETLVQSATTHVQRMQKALVQMNLQLSIVISDITGVTGIRMLRAIIAGETNPHALAQHRDYRCQASEAEITAALTGHYRPEHVFVLQQNLELFDAYQRQLTACDAAIEAHVHTLAAQAPAPAVPLPAPRTRKKPRDNEPRFDIRTPLHHLTGVDLTQIDAIGPYSALRLLAEIGTDMSRWPTEKHFTSWLTLAPHNKISGGRLLSSRTLPSANRAAGILRMAAMSLGRTETALGAFYRRLAYRVGKAKAITATARKLAILVYRTLKDGLLYHDSGAAAYDAQHRLRVVRRLRQRAANLGFSLVNRETGELIEGTVS
ncbi:MAG: IS110 family transposase [Candidatus Rokubacteria bacterium GWA2_70_23]|nr:MAG: IS110 family transposase [Candidatus Rokubacteria bacterium GWA2_70_23]